MNNINYSYQIQSGFAKKYTYPKANSSNGGETQSEYNIRSSLANILSYSAAFSNSEFDPENGSIICEYKTDLTTGDKYLSLLLGRGRGNCNAYFVDAGEFSDNGDPKRISFKVLDYLEELFGGKVYDLTSQYRFGLYLSVLYDQTIADDLGYRFICDGVKDASSGDFVKTGTHYESIYNDQYKGQHFNDIGILIGTMTYTPGPDYNTEGTFTEFEKNPDITKCIDIYRLGSEDGIVDTLGRLIRRLRVLNVYGGNFYVSDTLAGDSSDMHSDGVTKKYGGDYRLRIHEDISETSSDNYQITGGLDLVNTNIGGYDYVVQDLFTFETNTFNTQSTTESFSNTTEKQLSHKPISPYSVVVTVGGQTYKDDGNGNITESIKIDYAEGKITGLDDTTSGTISYKYNDVNITGITFNPKVVFGDIEAQNADINSKLTANIVEIVSRSVGDNPYISTPVLHIKNSSFDCTVSIANINNEDLVNFDQPILATKVYGAVWM